MLRGQALGRIFKAWYGLAVCPVCGLAPTSGRVTGVPTPFLEATTQAAIILATVSLASASTSLDGVGVAMRVSGRSPAGSVVAGLRVVGQRLSGGRTPGRGTAGIPA